MKYILTVSLLAFALGVFADDYNYLVVEQTNNVAHDIVLTSLRKITFEGDNAVMHTYDNQTTEVPISILSRFCFSASPTAVESVSADSKQGVVAIYTLDGRRLNSQEAERLMAGVYILRRADGSSIKIVRK